MEKVAFIFSLFVLLFFVSCQNRHNGDRNAYQTYDDTKEILGSQEAESPTRFLSVTGTYRKNLVGKTVIEGTVRNSASTTTFKDVAIRVNFISQTGTIISSDNYTIYDYAAPNSSLAFKLKVRAPQAAESVSIEVLNAQAN